MGIHPSWLLGISPTKKRADQVPLLLMGSTPMTHRPIGISHVLSTCDGKISYSLGKHLLLKMAGHRQFVDLPIHSMMIFHGYVTVYQRVFYSNLMNLPKLSIGFDPVVKLVI